MSKKVLFIGNSATMVHDIPGTLSKLANEAGYSIKCGGVLKSSVTIAMHADESSELGQRVLSAIDEGYDVVFVQDNGNCVSSDEMREESKNAAIKLARTAKASGARFGIYFRPPYGYEKWGYSPFEQCYEFDKHFLSVADEVDSLNAYVNRAFAYAIKNTDYNMWGPDNAHTSEIGGYLTVCVFFVTVFGTSSSVLGTNGLPEDVARTLQAIADKIALDGETPW